MNEMRKLIEVAKPLFESSDTGINNTLDPTMIQVGDWYNGGSVTKVIENPWEYDGQDVVKIVVNHGQGFGGKQDIRQYFVRADGQDITEDMESEDTQELGYELEEIAGQMQELLETAMQLVRGTSEENRAYKTWYAHIAMAISEDHGFMGSSIETMYGTAYTLQHGDQEGDEY
jgi:hypothetical protein